MARITAVFVLFIAFTVDPALCEDGDLEITPNVRELLVKDGAARDLTCSVSSKEKDASLNWVTPSDTGVTRLEQTEITAEGKYRLQYSLKIANFSAVNVGDYVCKLKAGGNTMNKSISLNPVRESKSAPVFEYEMEPAALWCNINFTSTERSIKSMKWFKDEKEVEDDKRFSLIKENNTLIIKKPTRDDAGLYVARFVISSSGTKKSGTSNLYEYEYDCEVEFLAGPLVLDFEKSKNLIQEDNMELQCKVKGYPRAVVTWYKDKQVLNVSKGENKRVKQITLNGYQNARLFIENVEFSDAGEYVCEAYSAYFNETSSKAITVRVKDKLAALWPFLGIVGEVVVLCTIIFIYEKRRNKQAEQEENIAQEAKNDEKKAGVRHRGQKK